MHSLPCILILWCATTLRQGIGDARSINIVFSHEYKFAVDEDEKQQEMVQLDSLEANVRKELENSINILKYESQAVQFNRSENTGTMKSIGVLKRQPSAHITDLLVAGTTENVRPFVDTPHPPLEDEFFQRHKRNAQLAQLANRNVNGSPMHNRVKPKGMTEFEVISEEDLVRAKKQRLNGILIYIGITLLSVLGFAVIAFCFMTDPKSCIIAFGTGSPCCLIICPCVLHCIKKFLTPGEVVRDNTNKYIPGLMVHPDGKLETYDPTPEEIEAVMDIIDIIQNMA